MIQCEICKRDCESYVSLSVHLRSHAVTPEEYYRQYMATGSEGRCAKCGSPTKFIRLTRGFQKYCSAECRAKDTAAITQQMVQTNLKRYGVEYSSQSAAVQAKAEASSLQKFGTTHPSKSAIVQQSRAQTCLKRYGESVASKSQSVEAKRQQTCTERYGASTPLLNPTIQAAIQAQLTETYGVPNVFGSDRIKAKISATCKAKYGVESIGASPDIRRKIAETTLKSYGVESVVQSPEVQAKLRAAKANKFREIYTARLKEFSCTFLGFKPLSVIEYQCDKCGAISEANSDFVFTDRYARGYTPCLSCLPLRPSVSHGETEVLEFVQSILPAEAIDHGNRSLLNGQEIDIYIPSRKVGIEYNGLYFHSEALKDKSYHAQKTRLSEALGIQLIQIFEDEWKLHPEIVKSRLKSILGCTDSRIYARQCTAAQIFGNALVRDYLDANHIQGSCPSKYKYGLFFNTGLVAVMTFGQSRFSSGEFELLRYCSTLGSTVVGGAGKLLAAFHADHPEYKSLTSYADRRWSSGKLYTQLGFTLESISEPSYFYTNGTVRYNRLAMQKHKLIKAYNFSESLTELEMTKSLGLTRIFDCGQYKFVKQF